MTKNKHSLVAALMLLIGAASHAGDTQLKLKSPDGKIVVTVATDGHLNYAIQFSGKTVVEKSTLGVMIDGQDWGQAAAFSGKAKTSEIDESYPMLGAHDVAVNHCRSTIIPLTSDGTPWQLEVRIFNDGAAFRYRIPNRQTRHIGGESSEWTIPSGAKIWSQSADNTSYEARYSAAIVGQQTNGLKIMAPAALKFANGAGYGIMTEADLIDYSDMSLLVESNVFKAFFHNDQAGWNTDREIVSPWRVTILSANLNGLVNSDLIKNLCPPPAPDLAGAKWIRPGKSSWGWLSCYCAPKLDVQKAWIDRTKELGFEYYLIDDGWRDWNGGGDGAWNAMADIVKYAKTQGVDIWVWVNAQYVHNPADRMAYFQRAKDLGIVGLKIDFPQPANVPWVNWYEATLRDAAKLHLLVDFHGAVKPTGRERTWPNELTREGIAGREQGKSPALHDITLPFLRYVQGHADFTPTLFMPERLNGSSYPHELAMAVVYTSPFLCMGDDPQHYLDSAAVDFIKALPSVWDETLVLPGSEIGELAGFARRKGNDWFIGVINNKTPRKLVIPLNFLAGGQYKLTELADSPDRIDAFARTERTVSAKDKLDLTMRKDGGYAAWLRLENK